MPISTIVRVQNMQLFEKVKYIVKQQKLEKKNYIIYGLGAAK